MYSILMAPTGRNRRVRGLAAPLELHGVGKEQARGPTKEVL